MRPLEVWGGLECSVVRIGEAWRDQTRDTGHHDREGDLALIAELGIRTLRYPVLWERCQAGQPGACGWGWHDRRLGMLQRLGLSPIAGLLHHGMGPRGTGLLEPDFAEGLAAHAGQAAARYPFVEWWTPVNEPLSTARFACLYGYWHPHLHDEGAFLRAVSAQCRAVLLAMRAIRVHSRTARFLHTEDLGRVFSTPPLREQAEYENGRRWLSLDMLCGRLDRSHPWRGHLEANGVAARHLDELATGEAAPDLIGINHYVTSDRFLDHRTELYPPNLHGGNGRIAYADTEAVRVDLPTASTGWAPRLQEAWDRYRRPLVVAEAHLGCDDPCEQLRWFMEAWHAADRLRGQGADVRAVTAWALMGLVDWSTMLRERRNHYEASTFDARRNPPQKTLLADAVTALARSGHYTHPALRTPGWWRREDRIHATLRRPHGSVAAPLPPAGMGGSAGRSIVSS